jgi:hypothetical protein
MPPKTTVSGESSDDESVLKSHHLGRMIIEADPKYHDYYSSRRSFKTKILLLELIELVIDNGANEDSRVSRTKLLQVLIDDWNDVQRKIERESVEVKRMHRRHPTQLDRLLKDLEELGLLRKTGKVVVNPRSKKGKKKENAFYSINLQTLASADLGTNILRENKLGRYRMLTERMLELLDELSTLNPVREYLMENYGQLTARDIMWNLLIDPDTLAESAEKDWVSDESESIIANWRELGGS